MKIYLLGYRDSGFQIPFVIIYCIIYPYRRNLKPVSYEKQIIQFEWFMTICRIKIRKMLLEFSFYLNFNELIFDNQ